MTALAVSYRCNILGQLLLHVWRGGITGLLPGGAAVTLCHSPAVAACISFTVVSQPLQIARSVAAQPQRLLANPPLMPRMQTIDTLGACRQLGAVASAYGMCTITD
jgi:hypothetical protein